MPGALSPFRLPRGHPIMGLHLRPGFKLEQQRARSLQTVREQRQLVAAGGKVALHQSRHQAAAGVESLELHGSAFGHGEGNVHVTGGANKVQGEGGLGGRGLVEGPDPDER